MIFIGVTERKARQARINSLGLASWNNFGRLWATGVVSSCLAPGPRTIRQKDISSWCTGAIERKSGSRFVSLNKSIQNISIHKDRYIQNISIHKGGKRKGPPSLQDVRLTHFHAGQYTGRGGTQGRVKSPGSR